MSRFAAICEDASAKSSPHGIGPLGIEGARLAREAWQIG